MKKYFSFSLLLVNFVLAASAQPGKSTIHSEDRGEKNHKAYEIYNRLVNNEDDTTNFGTMAILYSDDTLTAAKACRIPVYSIEAFDESTKKVLKKLKPGGIAKPIETDKGVYIYRLIGKSSLGYKLQVIFIKY